MNIKLRRNLLKAALASFTPSYLFAQKTNDAKFPIPLTVSWSKQDLMNGETISYADLKGQVLVIYFWASWCPFCAEQSPEMNKLFINSQGKGLYVLGVSVDKDLNAAKTHLQKTKYSFPSAWLGSQDQSKLPKPPSVPFVLVYNQGGKLVQKEQGQLFAEDVQALARWIN